MNWLTQSFDEHTAAWILISSLIGGVIGASVKFFFEDVLRPRLGYRREAKAVVRQYTTPLVRSAEALERRINILIRNDERRWYDDDEYFRLSTLYVFGEFLGWVRIVERRFGFLPFESSKRGAEFNRRLNGLFRALSSHAYFRAYPDVDAVDRTQVPRLMLTAVGEVMTRPGETSAVLEFTEFLRAYASEPQFRRWFAELDALLREAHPADPLRWDRLIAAGANLRALLVFLDPRGGMVRRRALANLDRIATAEVRAALEEDLRELLPRKSAVARRPAPAAR